MKNYGQLLLFGSVILVAMGAILVAVMGNSSGSSDIRARASQAKGTQFTAIVSEIHDAEGAMTVAGMRFARQESGDLGTWTITTPPGFDFSTISSGAPVSLGVDPATFDASAHTATAFTIAPGR